MEETETKVCSKCGLEKPLSEFRNSKYKYAKDGKTYHCRSCENLKDKIKRDKMVLNNISVDIDGKTRICKICHTEKTLNSFYKNKYKSMGRDYECIECKKNTTKTENHRKYKKEYKQNNPEKVLLSLAKSRAIRDNIPFDITIEDIVIPEVCPVLGIPMFRGNGKPCNNSPSLDKIIPEKGYVKGNVRVISHRANALKGDGTAEEHLRISKYITECITQTTQMENKDIDCSE
jgi:hypothetical protein